MAAYAAVVSLMNNIEQIMKHHWISTSLDNDYIHPLLEKAGFLLDYIEGCYHHGGGNKEAAEALERRITSAAHAAEDVIESHIVDQIHAGTGEVRLACSLELQRIMEDIDAIITNVAEEKLGWTKEISTTNAVPLAESGETAMVGFDEELTRLLDELTGYKASKHIISIVGMGGTGKTTLAKTCYEHALVKEHFDIRAWAAISQQYDAKEIISKLLSCTNGKSTSGTSGEDLHKTLYGRRYLIVLDDLWSVEAWDEVKQFFPDNGNRSRVVLTTRLSNVANVCASSCLNLSLLDDDKSWKLFCEKASFPQKDDPPQLEDLGKKIVRSCKGLALSISVIGGLLLKSSRTEEYWMSVASDIKSISGSKENLDVLSLSYSHLPPHLKPCFLYMGVFKEDSEIKVSNLIKLWVGEGFVKPSESMELEEVGEGYITEMIDRNLILACRRGYNGRVKFCGIHDLLRDLSIKIAEEQEFVRYWPYEVQCFQRRPVYNNHFGRRSFLLARSITDYCNDRPDGFDLLRVLNNSYRYANSFDDEEYCVHANLRYLNFLFCYEYRLSDSIALSWNLQTLIYRGRITIGAPQEFWMMQQLRHIHFGSIHLPDPDLGWKVVILEKLQTLKSVNNLRLCEEVCNRIPNIKKLHLCYEYDESCIQGLSNLALLHKLESFKLDCDEDYGVMRVVRFPTSLKKVSLKICSIDWEDMTTKIGSLPQLEVLHLTAHERKSYNWDEAMKIKYLSPVQEWTPIDGQFLHLQVLKMEYCSLHVWNADCSHFPLLKRLLLKGLSSFKEIPSGIGEIQTLQLIRVEDCSASATVSAIRIKEGRLDFDDEDDLQIQVKLFKSDLESFMKILETEELTTNNIQFQDREDD